MPYIIIAFASLLALGGWVAARYSQGRIPGWFFLVMLILVIALAAFQGVNERRQAQKEKYGAVSGTLISRATKDIKYPKLALGTAVLNYLGPEGEPIFLLGQDAVRVWIEAGKLKISTTIRDESGRIVARLEANEWQVNPGLAFDRNFTRNALEVVDAKGQVVLQVILEGDVAQFAGVFHTEDGWSFAIGKNIIEKRPPGVPLSTAFDPIFVYHSSLHPGKLRTGK